MNRCSLCGAASVAPVAMGSRKPKCGPLCAKCYGAWSAEYVKPTGWVSAKFGRHVFSVKDLQVQYTAEPRTDIGGALVPDDVAQEILRACQEEKRPAPPDIISGELRCTFQGQRYRFGLTHYEFRCGALTQVRGHLIPDGD